MISCNLKGGIGNQLFQISTTYAHALENNDIAVFDFDKCYTPMQGCKSTKYKDTIFKNVKTTKDFICKNNYTELKHSYDTIPYSENLLLDGYFQSELYFKNKREEVINLYNLSYRKNEIEEFIKTIPRPIVSVHIRRGDYLSHNHIYNILTHDYYKQAMDIYKNCSFLFISDDIEFVKQNYPNSYYSTFNDEMIDLILMSLCDHNIIANSTFSWWGAWLNKNDNKTVVGPKKWFSDQSDIDSKNIIPKSWIQI
jgi:hypothetical protein